MADRLYTFVGGSKGPWKIGKIEPVIGAGLERVERLDVLSGSVDRPLDDCVWMLRGVTSNERYVNRVELDRWKAIQPRIGRSEATCAALIPIKKTAAWWALAQDERRAILEEQAHHIATGLKYLPAVARRLHHGYDLGEP